METMQELTELDIAVFQLRMGFSPAQRCVDWAVERLRLDQEGDDLDIVLLASARGADEEVPMKCCRWLRPSTSATVARSGSVTSFWRENISSSCVPPTWRAAKAWCSLTPS